MIRSDAKKRRDQLLLAAEQVMAERGFDVPLEVIAHRAEVGRGTLYRNFADRAALADALLEQELQRLEELSVRMQGRDDAFFVLLRDMAAGLVRTGQLIEGLRAMRDGDPAAHLRARIAALYAGPLERAKASGAIREDFATEDVVRISAMLMPSFRGVPAAQRDEYLQRCVDLLIDGVRMRADEVCVED